MKKHIFSVLLILLLCISLNACNAEYEEGKTVHLRGTYKNKSIGLKATLPEGVPILPILGDPKYKFKTEPILPRFIEHGGAYIDATMYCKGAEISVIILDLNSSPVIGVNTISKEITENDFLKIFVEALKENHATDANGITYNYNEVLYIEERAQEQEKFAGRKFLTQFLAIRPYNQNEFNQDNYELTLCYTIKVRRIDDMMIILYGEYLVENSDYLMIDRGESMEEMWTFFKKA